jgi:hypothetical protein
LPPNYHSVHITEKNVEIKVSPGKKSANDFRVHYREPGKRVRTPKHIHLIIDLYMKLSRNKLMTEELLDHIINEIILKVQPSTSYPPRLQVFSKNHVDRFRELDSYGEYSVEFILIVVELIMIQEKTNYPNGTMNLRLFEKFRKGADIFEVVSAATFTGR